MVRLLLLLALLSVPADAAFLVHGSGSSSSPTVVSVQLSGSSVKFGATAPYYVGTLTTNLSPQTPTFNNLTGAAYQIVASGGSCSGGDTTHFQIIGDGIYTNTLAANVSPGYKLCITASATGLVSSYTATFTGITEGNKIDAAATYCAAHGGGNGTSGSPWQAACIQAAINAAVTGDTVYLASGNWALNTANTGVNTGATINLVGAGSGNTFNAVGNPSNANGNDPCPNTSPGSIALTCVATAGTTNIVNPSGGWIQFVGNNHSPAIEVSHMVIDGSLVTAGGDANGTLNFDGENPISINDIRVLGFADSSVSAEAQFSVQFAISTTIANSVFASPLQPQLNGRYSSASALFLVAAPNQTYQNTSFYETGTGSIASDNIIYKGITVFQGADGSGNVYGTTPSVGTEGSGLTNQFPIPGAGNGSTGFSITNSYLLANGTTFGLGGGTNDPGTGGAINNISFTGNTVSSGTSWVASCVSHLLGFGFNSCPSSVLATSATWSGTTVTFVTPDVPQVAAIPVSFGIGTVGFSSGYNTLGVANPPVTTWPVASNTCSGGSCTITVTCGGSNPPCPVTSPASTLGYLAETGSSEGMQINGQVRSDCTGNDASPTSPFTIQNNTIVGTSGTYLDLTGTGLTGCRNSSGTYFLHNNSVVGVSAQQNYISSASNQYLHDVNSITPTVTGNFCVGSTFTQSDSTSCATSGFTTPPTVSFTLGPLEEPGGAYDVPFVTTNFTAQYGAVQWLASSSPTTPSSGGQSGTGCNGSACSWSHVPPAYLAGVTHGNTVYLWVMDSANQISAPASALIQ